MAPPSGVNGVLPATVLQKNTPTATPRGPKAAQPRLKLVLRRLPPGLTKSEFDNLIGEEWAVGSGKVDYLTYRKGKVSKDLAKPSKPSRAYIHVVSQSQVSILGDHVRQITFHDAAKSFQDSALIGPPVLEFAPYSRIPGGRRRNDARQGLIDQDPEFKDFLESLTNPVAKPIPTDVNAEGQKEEKVTTTPLIEAIREKKANKDKPQSKGSSKHGRGEAKEDSTDKDHKKGGKGGKDTEKNRRMSKAEKAAKDTVKVLNKDAASANQSKDASAATEKGAAASSERKRERGSTSIAKSMLQRDLGIAPTASRKRGTKREVTTAAQENAPPKAEEPAASKSKTKETPASNVAPEKHSKTLHSPKKERPSRAERRAFKASLAEKTNKLVDEDQKSQSKAATPPTPVILKKPQNTTPAAAQSQVQPPKGPAASRAPPSEPGASRAPPTAPAAQSASSSATTQQAAASSTGPSRQAFLKHANASQGITEPLIEEALKVFGSIEKVEIDKRKGFAYVDFADPEGLQKAIAASPVKVAQGAVQVLERKEKVVRNRPQPHPHTHPHPPAPTGPSRGRGGFPGRGRGRGGGRGGGPIAVANTVPPQAPKAAASPAPSTDAAT